MEKTAVEWLEAHLIEYGFDLSLHKFEIKQAKEMEKQQIEDAFYQRDLDEFGDEVEFEQYYNEIFKSE